MRMNVMLYSEYTWERFNGSLDTDSCMYLCYVMDSKTTCTQTFEQTYII